MRILESALVLLLAVTVSVKSQATSSARFSSFCGLLQNKIYCYGGSRGTRDDEIVDSTMFVLDISQANTSSMSDLQNNWKVETPNTAGVNTEKRRYSQCAVVGGTQLLLSGGYGGADALTPIVDQTIAFDVVTKSWKKYPNYLEGSFGNRQIYWAATTEVPSKGLAFYGGFEFHINPAWSIPTNQNFTAAVFNDGFSRVIGYTGVTYLDITNVNKPWSFPPQSNVPTIYSTFQSSIFDPATKKIFFFGGTFEDISSPGYVPISYKTWHKLSYAPTFDTIGGVWGNETLKGDIIPSERRLHTTTLLPNGESTVLLYGGERLEVGSGFIANRDYCFTLNLKTLTWTQQNINATFVDLLRCRHSAILANNDSLFIVNGFNGFSAATDMPIVLNISNPASITYVEKYTDPNVLLAQAKNDAQSSNNQQSSNGLSSGAIAGIAVGAAVVGILITVGIVFWLRKKKSEQTTNAYVEEEVAPIEVNWDEIDKQYEQMPSNVGYPLASVASTSPKSKEESTVVNSIAHSSVLSYPPNAIEQQIHRQKPDGGNF